MEAPLCQRCRELQRHLAALQTENRRLRQLLEESQRQGKRQAAPFAHGGPKPDPRKPGRKSGRRYGKKGHRPPPPPEKIDETYEASLPAVCPDCGGPVDETAVGQQYQAEIPRRPIYRQFNVHLGECRHCRRRVQGRHRLQTSDALGAAASQLGPDGQAALALLNKRLGLSHGKVVQCLSDLFGVRLTRGGSAQAMLRVARRCPGAYREIRQATRSAARLSVDETGWRVGGRLAWLHAWVGPRATCYAIDLCRSADALEDLIGRDYDGLLIHDGWSSYERFTGARHQQCLAHLLRRAHELRQSACRGAVRFPRQVIALFKEALAVRKRWGRRTISTRTRGTRRWELTFRLGDLVQPLKANADNERLAQHLEHYLDDWFTFLEYPGLEATNYRAEQAIRPAVVNRKVWAGNRTMAGAAAQAVLTSTLETCRQQARSGLDYVSQLLRGIITPILLPSLDATPA